MRGAGERGGGGCRIAVPRFASDVAGSGGPDLRRARSHRGRRVDHSRQWIVSNVDRLDRVARLLRTSGDHRGDRFADKAHGSDRQRMSRW